MKQVLVPILNSPSVGSGGGEAGQGKRGSEDMLAEAGVRVLGIEGVDKKRVARLNWSGGDGEEMWRFSHFARKPEALGCHEVLYIIESRHVLHMFVCL